MRLLLCLPAVVCACAASTGDVPQDAESPTDGTTFEGPSEGPTDSGAPDDTGAPGTGGGEPVRLFVNELMPANAGAVVIDDASPDWIELFNPGAFDVSLDGFTITDDLDAPDKTTLSAELVVPAQGYLVLWASGETTGGDHLPFKLSSEGEAVGLFFPTGEAADRISFGPTLDNLALTRETDGSDEWVTTANATPGAENEVD